MKRKGLIILLVVALTFTLLVSFPGSIWAGTTTFSGGNLTVAKGQGSIMYRYVPSSRTCTNVTAKGGNTINYSNLIYRVVIRVPVPSPSNTQTLPPATPAPEPSEPPPEPPAQEQPKPKPTEPPEGEQAFLTTEEALMLSLVNQERAKAGVAPLIADEALTRLARLKSRDMIDKNYFSHQSPTYGSPFDMMKSAGIRYTTAGENIAGASSVARAHEGLMNSPGHRKNILNPAFTRVGIGIVRGGAYGMMFTQMFVGR